MAEFSRPLVREYCTQQFTAHVFLDKRCDELYVVNRLTRMTANTTKVFTSKGMIPLYAIKVKPKCLARFTA
jgi:hypothetical protein